MTKIRTHRHTQSIIRTIPMYVKNYQEGLGIARWPNGHESHNYKTVNRTILEDLKREMERALQFINDDLEKNWVE